MKNTLLTSFLMLLCQGVFSQINGFYSEFEDINKEWRVGDVLEIGNGFLLSFREQLGPIMESKIVRVTSEGEFLNEMNLVAIDTSINLCNLYLDFIDSSCVVALGVCTPSDGNSLLLTLCLDSELNELGRKLIPLPGPNHENYRLDDFRFLQGSDGYFAALSYKRLPSEKELKICKISCEGNMIQTESFGDSLVPYVANLFHIRDRPTEFGAFVGKQQIPGSYVTSCVLVYDGDIRLKRVCDIVNWYEDDGSGNVYGGNIEVYNSMIRPSPDGGFIISSRLNEFTVSTNDRSSALAKTDFNFTIQPQCCIIGHLNDTIESPAFYKSVDVNREGMVFQCSMQNIIYGSWPYGSNGTHLVVTKTDTDLNIIWQKRFMRDGSIYSAFQTIATADGGYLIVGNVYDHNIELRQNVFILKINAEGFVGVDEIQEESMAFVYPNPAKEAVNIGGVEAEETVVYNTLGQRVMSFRGNEANVGVLADGVYLLRVTDGKGLTHTIRIVVNK